MENKNGKNKSTLSKAPLADRIQHIHTKLKEVYSITGVPFGLISNYTRLEFLFPAPPVETVDNYNLNLVEASIHSHQLPLQIPLVKNINSASLYCLLRLDEELLLVMGPVATTGMDFKNYLLYMKRNFSPELVSLHMKTLYGAPKVDLNYFYNTIILVTHFLCDKVITPTDMIVESSVLEGNMPALLDFFDRHSLSLEHLSFENEIYHLIKTGNIARLDMIQSKNNLASYYYFQENDIFFLRIAFIFYGSICCHYASMGGLPRSTIQHLLQDYLLKTEACTHPQQFWSLLPEFSRQLCQKVHETNHPQYASKLLKTCITYIEENLDTRITIEMLEKRANASRRTILRHFQTYLNTTPAQFIHDEKLKEVAYLLEHSDMSVIVISNLLGYSSQSHLNKCFIEKYGCTPIQYRTSRRSLD